MRSFGVAIPGALEGSQDWILPLEGLLPVTSSFLLLLVTINYYIVTGSSPSSGSTSSNGLQPSSDGLHPVVASCSWSFSYKVFIAVLPPFWSPELIAGLGAQVEQSSSLASFTQDAASETRRVNCPRAAMGNNIVLKVRGGNQLRWRFAEPKTLTLFSVAVILSLSLSKKKQNFKKTTSLWRECV